MKIGINVDAIEGIAQEDYIKIMKEQGFSATFSGEVPLFNKLHQSKPDVWISRCFMVRHLSFGKKLSTLSSKFKSPFSSAIKAREVVAIILVVEAISKRVFSSTLPR